MKENFTIFFQNEEYISSYLELILIYFLHYWSTNYYFFWNLLCSFDYTGLWSFCFSFDGDRGKKYCVVPLGIDFSHEVSVVKRHGRWMVSRYKLVTTTSNNRVVVDLRGTVHLTAIRAFFLFPLRTSDNSIGTRGRRLASRIKSRDRWKKKFIAHQATRIFVTFLLA